MSKYLESTREHRRELATKKLASTTVKAYAIDIEQFENFCTLTEKQSFPPRDDVVLDYINARATTHRFSTLCRFMRALTYESRMRGYAYKPCQDVVDTLGGIKHLTNYVPTQKTALTEHDVRSIISHLGSDIMETRDRAMLLLGFWGALRCSEIAALNVSDVAIQDNRSLRINVLGYFAREVRIASIDSEILSPTASIESWLYVSKAKMGPLFLTLNGHRALQPNRVDPADVRRCIKRLTKLAGLVGDYSSFSMRAGYATSAEMNGARFTSMKRHTGHKHANSLLANVRPKKSTP